MITIAINDLKQRWDELLKARPDLRIRNAADELGVSEAELLATGIGDGVIRLKPDFHAILAEINALGRAMALTRNDDVVHERKGVYLNPTLGPGPVGLFVGADIDLRIFWGSWSSAFAVSEPAVPSRSRFGEARAGSAVRFSLQFFAGDGSAIHKIYLTPESNAGAYHDLVEKFRAEDQTAPPELRAWPAEPPARPDDAIDAAAFRTEWLALKDTHDFHMLLRKFGVTRPQALRLAPVGHAVPVANKALREVLTSASAKDLPIMIFVGNRGMLQIHTGPVKNVVDARGWLNVLDPDFNLHVREEAIAQSWIVRKPTSDGTVTALECFDADGGQIVQLFGKRKPGIPEMEEWRSLITAIEALKP